MSTTERYNGWSNYQTWNVKLWIDNEEGSYNYWREAAQECWDATDEDSDDRESEAQYSLAKRLESEYRESMPDVRGTWSDLLGSALSAVDWHEIAAAMIEECDRD